jgi:diguanylate cyclase (GGDEF)-like protein
MDKKFRRISIRFLALTTPAYLGFFIILLLIRCMGYDQFSDEILLIGLVHVFGLQSLHWALLANKREVSRNYMVGMLWFMVYNNVLVFGYWVSVLENTRSFIYMLAPMSVISLFSLATMRQAVAYNFILALGLAISAIVGVMKFSQPFESVGLDWIYIGAYFIVSLWLSNLSDLYSKNREQLREVIHSEQSSKKELEYTLNKLAQVNVQLEEVSYTDALTQVFNRRYFDQAIDRVWGVAILAGQPLSLLMIDVDLFKNFNDKYGHQVGDECLKEVAGVISQCLGRQGDKVCRYGGEEFVVILQITNINAAVSVAKRIRIAVSELRIVNEGKMLDVTISIGISTVSKDNVIESIEALICLADDALYQAKGKGRNCTVHSAQASFTP